MIPEQGPTHNLDIHYVLLLHDVNGWQLETCAWDVQELEDAKDFLEAKINEKLIYITETQVGD